MSTTTSQMRIVALVLALAGAAVGLLAPFVDYWHYADGDYGYALVNRHHLVTLAFANAYLIEGAAIVGLAVTSLFRRSLILWAVAAAFSTDLFLTWTGETVAPGIDASYLGHPTTDWGCYLGMAGAAVALAGAALGLRDTWERRAFSSVAAVAAGSPATPPGFPPAGWFPDPAGSGGQRWWDGRAWTNETGFTANA
ncbi:MAG: hypothetical protein QOE43_1647 [Gaiellaceae bacterium]|nr:hypothetical protein [Gaiellaceae bacterium]